MFASSVLNNVQQEIFGQTSTSINATNTTQLYWSCLNLCCCAVSSFFINIFTVISNLELFLTIFYHYWKLVENTKFGKNGVPLSVYSMLECDSDVNSSSFQSVILIDQLLQKQCLISNRYHTFVPLSGCGKTHVLYCTCMFKIQSYLIEEYKHVTPTVSLQVWPW